MDAKIVTDALDAAQNGLNTLVDSEFKARRITALRTLTLAQNAVTLAQKHIAKAVEQSAPKQAAVADAPATTGKKK